MCRKRKANDLLSQLKVLTPNARERWAILTTMLEMTIEKIKNGKERPILLRPWEIKKHKVGSVRNTVELLGKTSIIEPHEPGFIFYEFKFTKDGISHLFIELRVWDEIIRTCPVDSLTLCSLQMIREVLNELKRLLEGSIPQKS